jgi:hypothetical protein
LMQVVNQADWPNAESEKFRLELGLLAWGTILIYRARMVPFHFNRELKRLVNERGEFFERNPATPLSRGLLRQQLTMQLGIEAITRRRGVKERIAEVPVFQQYIYDTLYWPSYQHEKGIKDLVDGEPRSFELSRKTLEEYRLFRATGSHGKRKENFPGEDITDVLFKALESYLELLRFPKAIRNETINYASQLEQPRDQRLWASLAEAVDLTRPLVEIKDPESANPT